MNFFEKLYCRAVQALFRVAIPFMPYKQPALLMSCDEAARLIVEKGKKKPLIVTDEGVRAHGVLDHVTEALDKADISYEIYDKTHANPTMSEVEGAVTRYYEAGCDSLIAVGGGSPMDCAKGVCARLIAPKKSLLQMRGVLKVRGRQPLFIAVPTTAGTGSEATIAAVLTDERRHDKFTILAFCLAPRYALLDPVLTKSLPPASTAETGMNALTHAVEAYIGRATTRLTRRLSVEAVSLIKENLPLAYADGEDLEARKNMQLAAFKAGLAFTISYVGYVHAIAHSLGGAYNYPHGRTNATLLPVVLKAYGKPCVKKLARLARESGVFSPSLSDMDASKAFIAWVEELNSNMGIPARIEIEKEDIPALAKHAAKEANPLYPVPRLFDAEELAGIYFAVRSTGAAAK